MLGQISKNWADQPGDKFLIAHPQLFALRQLAACDGQDRLKNLFADFCNRVTIKDLPRVDVHVRFESDACAVWTVVAPDGAVVVMVVAMPST